MSECTHCHGTGKCNDDYHESFYSGGVASDFILGSDCPSGCDGSSGMAGDCPHCGGTGEEDD